MNVDAHLFAGHCPSDDPLSMPAAPVASPWLSLLVPVYNVAPFIEDCLTSIASQIQGLHGIEVILLDDMSTDDSMELCRRFAAGHRSQVSVLQHGRNRGIAATRNTLLDAARGDYVWFVDSDDMLLPGAIAALSDIILQERPDVVLCDYLRHENAAYPSFTGSGRCLTRCTETLIAGTFEKRRLHLWSRVWRRTLFDDGSGKGPIRFPEGARFEDVATVPWLLLRAESFYYAAQPWVFYRSRPGSIMAVLNRARTGFDRQGNDDMARALGGFGKALDDAVPSADMRTRLLVARFISREFAKIVKRRLRGQCATTNCARWSAWAATLQEIHRYRRAMEGCSPVPFDVVLREYLKRGKLGRGLELALWLALARAPRPEPSAAAPIHGVTPEGT